MHLHSGVFFVRAFRCRFSRCHQAAGGLQREFRLNALLFCASGDDAALQHRFGSARKMFTYSLERFHVFFSKNC